MTVELNWGTDAAANGLGAIQDVVGLIDFALLETGPVMPVTASSTYLEFPGSYLGETLIVAIEGTNLQTLNNALSGGDITSITIYNSATGSLSDNIVSVSGAFDGAELRALAVAEVTGTNTAAIENYFTNLDWVYNGTSAQDMFPFDAVSEDGIPLNLKGNDEVRLLQGDDVFFAGDGDDKVWGASGEDYIQGGNGHDQLRGSTGDDTLVGGAGDDFLSGQRDDDLLLGGDGNDRIIGGGGEDELEGDDGDDFLKGGFEDDFAAGGGGDDTVNGNAGNDILTGVHGNDLVRGGGGNDFLLAIAGDDRLKGGSGVDTFIFAPTVVSSATLGITKPNTTVLDFDLSEDFLMLSDIADPAEGFVDLSTLTGVELSLAQMVTTYASVQNGNVVFDFGTEGSLTINGLTSTDGLEDQMVWLSEFDF